MITVGSVSREEASEMFDFLSVSFRGRRKALRELTHTVPEFVFWIYPDGKLLDARTSHRENPPPGHEHILNDELDYGGFLRGRVVRYGGNQLLAIYCRPEALVGSTESMRQLLRGLSQMPIPIEDSALVVSDNGDIYGTVADLYALDLQADSERRVP